jgi:hypothetical protein
MKRRTEITIETSRLTLIGRRGGATRAWCPLCEAHVEMVSHDQAVGLLRVSTRIIHQMVDEEKLHFIETPDGLLLICVNSLFQWSRSESAGHKRTK